MTPDDLDRIERELAVTLPASYRALLCPFPLPALAGNTDTDLWDSPSDLIERNRRLRAGADGAEPWPHDMYFVGESGASSCYALDLTAASAPVWWVDHWELDDGASGAVAESFTEWARALLRDLRHDLERDGIDPKAPPSRPAVP